MHAGDIVDGRFEIERRVGAGGMGQVYLARDREKGEPVAIKVLLRSGLLDFNRFAREAQSLAAMRFPGVVRYIAHGTTGAGEPYLAMEWLAGETLAERLERQPLTILESVDLLKRVASTLGAVHRLGVVHRDVKPSNLILVDGAIERVTLLDFGLARNTELAQQLTAPGAVVGTPGYMAPEQVRGEPPIDARADVFALGCVLFECIAGRPAFIAPDLLPLLMKVVLEDPPRLREVSEFAPAWLDDLVARMLAKDPDRRPADAQVVAEGLAGYGGSALPLDPDRQTQQPPSSRGLTTSERKLQCLILADDAWMPSDATLTPGDEGDRQRALREIATHHGGRLDSLQERWLLVALSGGAAPTDLATRAARCALEMRRVLGDRSIAIVLGRAESGELLSMSELIERAAQLLSTRRAQAVQGAIHVDDVAAAMLAPRFELAQDAAGHRLRGPKETTAPALQLLGRPTEFVGRDRELAALSAQLRHCVEEQTAIAVLITGVAGMGKSRLRHEFLSQVEARGEPAAIWIGQADSMSAGSAFALLSRALRGAFGITEGEPLAARREQVLSCVARHPTLDAPRVAAFLGEITGTPFPDEQDVRLRAARRNPMLMSDQIRLAWEEFLRAECAVQPVLLVLEDVHWGDLPTFTLVDAALRHLAAQSLMVIAFGRPDVHDAFPKLWQGRLQQEIRLTPLSPRASERLVRQALEGVSDDLVGRLIERADGNAFYLEELIRAAMSDQGAALPESVLAMVQARLEALHPSARQVLRAASIYGQSFWQRGVETLVGAMEVEARLADLAQREIVVRRGGDHRAGDAAYRFRHALVREAAYGMLTKQDRRVGHALAGAWLEQTGDADPMALGEHFERGAEPARAARAYLRAAEQALRGSDLRAAIERAERGMACDPEPETAGGLRLVEAEAHLWRGDLALAEEHGAAASERLPEGSARWFLALAHVIEACGKLGAGGRVDRWSAVARDAVIAEGALGARMVCLSRGANAMVFRGDYASADALLEAIEQPRSGADAPDPDALAQLYQTRAFRSVSVGDSEASLRRFEDVLAAFEQSGDRRHACSTRANLACFHLELGDFAGAEALLRAALATAEQMELHELVAVIWNNLGHALAYAGKLDEAKAVEDAALDATQRMGLPRVMGNALTYLAKIALFAGDFAASEREARAAADVLRVAPPLRAAALAVLAQALLGLGRADEALDAAREAYLALETLGGVEEGESLIRLTYAEALAAAGQQAEAARAIAAAEEALMTRAAKFRDPRWRDSFLDKVPEHARTRELARRWLGRAE